MRDLLIAIRRRWDSRNLDATITGGLHTGRLPPDIAMPYCVLTTLGSVPEYTTTQSHVERYPLQFAFFGTDDDLLLGWSDIFDRAFNHAALLFDGQSKGMLSERSGRQLILDVERLEGRDVWQVLLEYMFTVQHELIEG